MNLNNWFANYGQIVQILLAIAALGIFKAWPELKTKVSSPSLTKIFYFSLAALVALTVFNAVNPQRDSLPANLSADLKDLPSKSRALLMLLTQNQEAWDEKNADTARKAADSLKDRAYAIDLKQDELRSIAAVSGRKLSYGLRLTDKGVKLHDQMVKVLEDMLGTAEATDWIKERRHEPSPANLSQ